MVACEVWPCVDVVVVRIVDETYIRTRSCAGGRGTGVDGTCFCGCPGGGGGEIPVLRVYSVVGGRR